MSEEHRLRDWSELSEAEQTRLLETFGRHQDGLPATCSLELKVERFRAWLRQRGIGYRHQR